MDSVHYAHKTASQKLSVRLRPDSAMPPDRARRKLGLINRSKTLDDLRIPPGNRLHALKDERLGQHSISINDQWRICFVWRDGNAYDVEITDYH